MTLLFVEIEKNKYIHLIFNIKHKTQELDMRGRM